jgi:uncharacterized membrane protein YedE/YeeE
VTRTGKQALVSLSAGLLFGVGLVLAGMTQPQKVIGFLDFGGEWDPSLALVMLGAIAVHVFAYRAIRGSAAPLFADEFALPTKRSVDTRLLLGSAVFGIGWGLAGYCPGPALVTLGRGSLQALAFVPAMLAGMFLAAKLESWLDRPARRTEPASTTLTPPARGTS